MTKECNFNMQVCFVFFFVRFVFFVLHVSCLPEAATVQSEHKPPGLLVTGRYTNRCAEALALARVFLRSKSRIAFKHVIIRGSAQSCRQHRNRSLLLPRQLSHSLVEKSCCFTCANKCNTGKEKKLQIYMHFPATLFIRSWLGWDS